MATGIWMLAGFLAGSVTVYAIMKPLHWMLEDLQSQYKRIVEILQEWQKKI